MGLRDDILTTDDLPREAVDVPEWGTTVFVRAMTGTERDLYEAGLMENKDLPMKQRLKDMRANLVVLCSVDADGERIFDDEDVAAIGGKSAKALNRIVEVAQNLNALSDGDIEEIAGN